MDRVLVKYWVNGLDMSIVNIILNIENHFKGLLCNCKCEVALLYPMKKKDFGKA